MTKKKDISSIKDRLKMQTYAQFRIDNIFTFLKFFREFFLEDVFFYRGQADATWGLKTSYERYKNDYGPSLVIPEYFDSVCDRNLFRGELAAINYFQATNESFSNTRHHPKLEVLSEMQHYGASTRLLDVTESFGVALFFAVATIQGVPHAKVKIRKHQHQVKKTERKETAVWAINKRVLLGNLLLSEYKSIPLKQKKVYLLFNPYKRKKILLMEDLLVASFSKNETELNEQLCDFAEELIGNEEVIKPPRNFPYCTVYPGVFAVRPMFFNNRLHAQNGLFLLQQSLEHSFMDNLLNTLNISRSEYRKEVLTANTPNISDGEYDSELLNTALIKFIIPPSEFESCKSILKAMNINYKSLFPDKYGIIKTAEKKYFPE